MHVFFSFSTYHNMSSQDRATPNSNQSSGHAAHKIPGSGIGERISGVVNILHGTGEIIRGHTLDARNSSHGTGKPIAAAGREEVERGLDKLEGKPTRTSAGSQVPDRGGDGDGTGAVSGRGDTTAQASAAATRADITAKNARVPAADAGYPADNGTASAAPGDTGSRRPEQRDDTNVQRDTGVGRQGPRTTSEDRDNPTGTTTNAPIFSNVEAQDQPSGTVA
ncbi:hypothetical protein BJV74DRAFT_854465 [Russula compacta]|nr:hypothetical protein BJV74DRAFT_854465 [Russula compacta]